MSDLTLLKLSTLLLTMAATLVAALPMRAQAQAQSQACTDWGKQGKLLYADDFSATLDRWVQEFRAAPGSSVTAANKRMTMDLAGDATVWFKPKLSGDILISYRRKVLMNGGANDRLSDLNQFWMATDPQNENLFTRDGTFKQYDNLRLYYAGIGGNSNTTTRLRKYDGGERTLLSDLGEQRYLLEPNREYTIQIAVYKGCTRLLVDGVTYFSYRDPAPLTAGYFGLRTTHSRQEISDFKVYQLQ